MYNIYIIHIYIYKNIHIYVICISYCVSSQLKKSLFKDHLTYRFFHPKYRNFHLFLP